MSRNYDNWEKLVGAVLRREELWQLCHEDSTDTSACSDVSTDHINSSWSSSVNSEASGDAACVLAVWERKYKTGVYVTLVAFEDGTRFIKRVRFSRLGFDEHLAVAWWFENREKVYKKYNALGGNTRIKRPLAVVFSWSPLIDQEEKVPVLVQEEKSTSKVVGSVTAEKENSFHLSEFEMLALQELKQRVLEALHRHEFGSSSSLITPIYDGARIVESTEETDFFSLGEKHMERMFLPAPEEVIIWGVKLMEDEKTDTVLLKFLRAREYVVKDAFSMIKSTIQWRKEFGMEGILEEDLGSELERVLFMHGCSKDGHPVCYSAYGEFQDTQLYSRTFSDEEKRQKCVRWRIQFFEKSIKSLNFRPGGISKFVLVQDLKNSPGSERREIWQATNLSVQLLQDNYPEFVAKQIFINVPWWYVAFDKMISPLLTQSTRDKFKFARPSSSIPTLFKYISADQIPPQYGGLSKDGEFGIGDNVTEIMVKPSTTTHIEEFCVTRACRVKWEVRVSGWEVSYGAKFVSSDGHTNVVIEKDRRIGSTQDRLVSGSFRVGYPGMLLVTITYPFLP